MIVINQSGDTIVECNELTLMGNQVVAYVTGYEGCRFAACKYDTEEQCNEDFNVVADDIFRGDTVIDFRRVIKNG